MSPRIYLKQSRLTVVNREAKEQAATGTLMDSRLTRVSEYLTEEP